jgi:hypothetical protein
MDPNERRIAKLANPYVEADPGLDVALPEPFVRENRLSLLLRDAGVPVPGVKGIESELHTLTEELAELVEAFDAADVEFLLIKFPDLPKRHRDLDVLVVDGGDEVGEVLLERGYRVVGDGEPHKRGYERTRAGTEISVDLHHEISWWGNVYLDKWALWNGRVTRDIGGASVPVPGPVGEVLVSAASDVFGEIQVNLFEVLHVEDVVAGAGIDVATLRERARAEGWRWQFDYFASVCDAVYRELYDETVFGIDDAVDGAISRLPYRYPVGRILALRWRRVGSLLKPEGPSKASVAAWGYLLETTQLGLDFVRVRTGLPNHPILNMRRWL